jgi:hypothetical protein
MSSKIKTFCLLCVLGIAMGAASQSTTEIRGRVQDNSGHAITSAFVIITSQDTSLLRAASSDDAGDFAIPSLPVGTYSIEVKADGFAAFTSKDVRASIGEVVRLEIVLAEPGTSIKIPFDFPPSRWWKPGMLN